MGWITKSNRQWHFLGAIVLSFLFTFFCGLGAALGLELKDVQHQNPGIVPWKWDDWSAWDWLDFLATILGSLVGQGLQILILWLCIG
jgi:hypothetical protein